MGEFKILLRPSASTPPKPLPVWVILTIGALALAARLALFPYVSEDSRLFFVPWMEEFRNHGASALGGEFSNYNFPYMFLLFLGSLLPAEPHYAIKIVSLAGDCLLALSVRGVVQQLRPARIRPEAVALIALFLPTVLLNASMWGQCDSIYSSFLLLSLRSLLRDDGPRAWLWWAVALSFKLQAVFFLPALALIALRNRHSLALPAMAAGVWALLSSLPVLFGRTLTSTFSVYFHQTQEDLLTNGAVNVYAWFPSVSAAEGRVPAILICGIALLIMAAAYWRRPDSIECRVLLTVTSVALCPFLLPQMHDRYFFAAEVMSLLLLGRKKVFFIPGLLAATGLLAYSLHFIGNRHFWPLMLGSIVQCLAVAALLLALWRTNAQKPSSPLRFSPRKTQVQARPEPLEPGAPR
jgi:Gpi18-like mannosyltransferase